MTLVREIPLCTTFAHCRLSRRISNANAQHWGACLIGVNRRPVPQDHLSARWARLPCTLFGAHRSARPHLPEMRLPAGAVQLLDRL